MLGRGVADYAEQPSAKARTSVKPRASVQYLQVAGLQDILGFRAIPRAATERPPKCGDVVILQLGVQFIGCHSNKMAVFAVVMGLVVWRVGLYDRC